MEKQKTTVDVDIFKTEYMTPQSAYILGFIWADGCVRTVHTGKANVIRVEIKPEDGEALKNVFYALGYWPTYYITRKISNKKSILFCAGSKSIADYLTFMGYQEKTSCPKILNTIPDNLKHYWWRGYSDGDGCFYIGSNTKHTTYNYTITGPYDQDWSFVEEIFIKHNLLFSITRIINKWGKKSYIRTCNKADITTFGKYIYRGYPEDQIGLNRKYLKYLQLYLPPRSNPVVA